MKRHLPHQRPEVRPTASASSPDSERQRSSCSHLIEGLLELASPEDNLPRNQDDIGIDDILHATAIRINKLISFESHAFLLADEFLDFELHSMEPSDSRELFQQLTDQWIEDGIFSWALNQNRAVLLTPDNARQEILHVIATRAKIYGMFVGLGGPDILIDEGMLALLSVILINCANHLETCELNEALQRHAAQLENQVKERTRQLEIAKNRAEEAAKQKSAFLATMSHEIRTPMNGVIGMAQMLQHTALDDSQQEYTRIISQSGQSLVLLINDILDFSKIEAGKLRLDPRPMDLAQLCRDVIALLEPQADAKQLKLSFSPPTTTSLKVIGDCDRLRQILTNLLGNAIKFTEQGSVTIELQATASHGDHQRIRLGVHDTGIGISPQNQAKLFTPFSQLHAREYEKQKGTGLGLAICKQLVEMMGGEISVDSAPGQGATFWIDVELANATEDSVIDQSSSRTATSAPHHFQGRVLIAEDHPVNQRVIQLMLQSLGVHSKLVEHGQEAVEALQNGNFDLVFMDCQMPVLDGYEATRLIRNLDNGNRRIPIVALSANAMEEDRDHCLTVGMDDFLAKPIDQNKLIATLSKWLAVDVTPTQIPPQTIPEAPHTKLIDTQRLDQLRALSPDQFKGLITSFLDHTGERLEKLLHAVEEQDIETVRVISHAIKGSCATFGALQLHKLSTELDTLAKEGQLAEIQSCLSRFSDCYAASRAAILDLDAN